MTEVEVVVVGSGVMGAATARALARAGREVVLLDQFQIGHERGSSHGTSRIFRYSYPDPLYVGMAGEALPLWRELEQETGEQILITTGSLDTGYAVEQHAPAMKQCGVRFEMLESGEAARRFPRLAFPPRERVLFQPDGGIVLADRAVAAFVASARSSGALIREQAPVAEIRVRGGRVDVAAAPDAYRAEVVVVTAGAWAKSLLAPAGIDLPVYATRETVAYFRVEDELSFPTLVEWGDLSSYFLPSPGQGIKAGGHRAGPKTDPDLPGEPSEESVNTLAELVRGRYPAADSRPHRSETCLYTNTSDERFIIERHGPIVVGSACSGHGFKFAPLIGRRLAALAMKE